MYVLYMHIYYTCTYICTQNVACPRPPSPSARRGPGPISASRGYLRAELLQIMLMLSVCGIM